MNFNTIIDNLKTFRKVEIANSEEDVLEFKNALFDFFGDKFFDEFLSRDDFFEEIAEQGINFAVISLPDKDSRHRYFERLLEFDALRNSFDFVDNDVFLQESSEKESLEEDEREVEDADVDFIRQAAARLLMDFDEKRHR